MRKCPFNNCGKSIKPEFFACAFHWFRIPFPERQVIYRAYGRYQNGEMSVEELRQTQQAVLDAVQNTRTDSAHN